MFLIVASVLVGAPLWRVWEVLADLESHPGWMTDAESIEFPAGQRTGAGTVMVVDTRIGPFRLTDRLEVTEWRERKTIAVDHRGLVGGAGRFDLSPMAGGIRVVWREDLRFPWWLGGPVAALLARPILARVWSRNLREFRDVVVELSDP